MTNNQEEPSSYDTIKYKQYMQECQDNQSLFKAIFFGFFASLLAASLWALVVVITNYQIGYMAIVVGFIVGITVKYMGKGIDTIYGIIGALLAVFSCILGDFLSTAYLASVSMKIDSLTFIKHLAENGTIFTFMKDVFQPIDLLFYGIALYEGYTFSFVNLELPEEAEEDSQEKE